MVSKGQTAHHGTTAVKCSFSTIMRSPTGTLRGQIVAEQAGAFFRQVSLLRFGFERRLIGDVACRPDLAMRMRVAGAHHGASVLKDLNVMDPFDRRDFFGFIRPGIDDAANIRALHLGQREAVIGMEAEHFADSLHRFSRKQR